MATNNFSVIKNSMKKENESMSKPLTRTYSVRKHVRPLIDIDEEDDQQRRDSSGRKRVDVVQCLLDSSSDGNG